jgi:hypothetical protein
MWQLPTCHAAVCMQAWPATMGLLSFFALNIFFQALREALQ